MQATSIRDSVAVIGSVMSVTWPITEVGMELASDWMHPPIEWKEITMRLHLALLAVSIATPSVAGAQHHDSSPAPPAATAETEPEDMEHEGMPPSGPLGIPASRRGSGTAWLPDDSPMRAIHWMIGDWALMAHGNVFVGYDAQGSNVGESKIVSQNWFMAMASRPLGGGTFSARGMFSLEPLTLGDDGYPLLLQTGEGLVDAQHPHDLIMEAATRYERELGGGIAFDVYTALAGEPALGPVAFPHRPSAMLDPMAPLGHHWEDSTHISFGVLTAGLFTRHVKLEGSWFNGREPDTERLDLDLRRPDSYATRLSVNPSAQWSLQASYGYLASPEPTMPEVSVQRATASATHAMKLGDRRSLSATLGLGHNDPSEGPVTHSALAEAALDLSHLGTTFARAEYVLKAGEDFELPMADMTLPVSEVSLGHVHPVARLGDVETALGVRGSVGLVDSQLESRYGTRTPLGMMAFVQLVPAAMDM